MSRSRFRLDVCRYREHLPDTPRTRPENTVSTRGARIEHRILDALGHGRGRRYRGSTRGAKDTSAANLWDLGGLILLQHPSSSVPQPAHPSRSPERRCGLARRPAGDEVHRLATSGGEGVVSGPYHRTHQHCRRADRDVEAPAADCLKSLVIRSRRMLSCLWHAAPDARSGL